MIHRLAHPIVRSSSPLLRALCLLLVIGFTGCAQLPRQNVVEGPTSAEPAPIERPTTTNGSIFAQAYVKPLFEDRRPRQVGDILTVRLDEQVQATKRSSARASREGEASFSPTQLPEALGDFLAEQGFDIEGSNDFEGQGGADASNSFDGTITVTVVDVLRNGNLQVVGEKRIGINKGVETIRFSGTVNPRDIGADSTITSSRIANARLEYYGDGFIAEAQEMGWFQRALLNVSPF